MSKVMKQELYLYRDLVEIELSAHLKVCPICKNKFKDNYLYCLR